MSQEIEQTQEAEAVANSPERQKPMLVVGAMIVAAIVAASASLTAVNQVGAVYPIPPEVLSLGAAPTTEEREAARVAQLAADTGNVRTWLAVIGAIIGGLLGGVAGMLTKSWPNAAGGLIIGCVLASAAGYIAGPMAVHRHSEINATLLGSNDGAEMKFMVLHAVTWGLFGAATGVAAGFFGGSPRGKSAAVCAIAGLVVAGLAGFVSPLVLAAANPLADATIPFPAVGSARVAWVTLPSLLLAAILGKLILAEE